MTNFKQTAEIFKKVIDDDAYVYSTRYMDSSDDKSMNLPKSDPVADFNAGAKAAIERVIEALESYEAYDLSLRKIGYIATVDAPNWADFIRDVASEFLK